MKNMKVICLVITGLMTLIQTHAQFNYGPSFMPCTNPNGNSGLCVALKDCNSILSIVYRQPLLALDREFIQASECLSGFDGMNRHVCCTTDTGYIRRKKQIPSNNNYIPYYSPSEGNNPFWDSPSFGSVSNNFFPINEYDNFQPQWSRYPTFKSIPESRQSTQSQPKSDIPLLSQPPTCGGVKLEKKIIGGDDADLFEFPWMVLLEYERKLPKNGNYIAHSCSGSLINQRYVLTAAHCVRGKIEKSVGKLVAIRLGEHDTSKKANCNPFGTCLPEVIRAGYEEVIPHDQYTIDSASQHNDIALIRLDRNIRFSDSVSPICLPSTLSGRSFGGFDQTSNTEFTVAGWGHTSFSPESAVKQKLNVTLFNQANCKRQFSRKRVEIVDTQICAGGKFGKDSCNGDSGGPLMNFRDGIWVLEGIISFGYKCGLEHWPGVYTRVASYENWIINKLRK